MSSIAWSKIDLSGNKNMTTWVVGAETRCESYDTKSGYEFDYSNLIEIALYALA